MIAGIYLLYPALTPAHVEGFTASMVSIGIHLREGNIGAYDRLHGFNLEFFALSRLGANLFIAGASQLLHISAEQALRLMMWVGGIVLAVASFPLIRRWSDAGAAAALIVIPLLLFPGIAESTFIYNDNVISAALTVAALAVAASSPELIRWSIAGVLFGLGVVARFDAVLLAVAFPLIAFEQNRSATALVRRGVAFGMVAAIVIVGIDAAYGTNPLEVLSASRYAVFLWHRDPDLEIHRKQVLLFVGIPGAMLIVLGVWQLITRRDYARLTLLAGVPIVYNLVLVGKLWEGRQLLPLTPFFAALAVRGIQYVFRGLKGTFAMFARVAVVAVTLAVILVPHTTQYRDDGPRSLFGRAWGVPVWIHWQQAVTGNLTDLRATLASVGGPATHPTALITDDWTSDRYTHMLLQQDGYRVVPIASAYPACASAAELFQRGDERVLHLRAHEPFLESPNLFLAERLNSYVMPCITAVQPSAMYITTWLSLIPRKLGERLPLEPRLVQESERERYTRIAYDPLVVAPLSATTLSALHHRYAADSVRSLRAAENHHAHALNVTEAERLLAPQVHFAQ